MSSALVRGRTLDRGAVEMAKRWREKRLKELESKPILSLTIKERHELANLRAQQKADRNVGNIKAD